VPAGRGRGRRGQAKFPLLPSTMLRTSFRGGGQGVGAIHQRNAIPQGPANVRLSRESGNPTRVLTIERWLPACAGLTIRTARPLPRQTQITRKRNPPAPERRGVLGIGNIGHGSPRSGRWGTGKGMRRRRCRTGLRGCALPTPKPSHLRESLS
jgi:hypothetical protein